MDDWELKISEVDDTANDDPFVKLIVAKMELRLREATARITKAKRGRGVQQSRKAEALAWLFEESTEPFSAWWVSSHLGIDLERIRHLVETRPSKIHAALQYRQRTKAA